MANKKDYMTDDEYKALTERRAKAWVSVIDADIAELRDGGTDKAVAAPLDQLSQFGELQKALERIADLESQLESIGACGVTRLVAQADAEPLGWRVGFEVFATDIEAKNNIRNPSMKAIPLYALSVAPQPAIAPEPQEPAMLTDTELRFIVVSAKGTYMQVSRAIEAAVHAKQRSQP